MEIQLTNDKVNNLTPEEAKVLLKMLVDNKAETKKEVINNSSNNSQKDFNISKKVTNLIEKQVEQFNSYKNNYYQKVQSPASRIHKRWNKEELELLKSGLKNEDIAKMLGRSVKSVSRQKYEHKCSPINREYYIAEIGTKVPQYKKWSNEEVQLFIDNIQLSDIEIAKLLKRSISSVMGMRYRIVNNTLPKKLNNNVNKQEVQNEEIEKQTPTEQETCLREFKNQKDQLYSFLATLNFTPIGEAQYTFWRNTVLNRSTPSFEDFCAGVIYHADKIEQKFGLDGSIKKINNQLVCVVPEVTKQTQ